MWGGGGGRGRLFIFLLLSGDLQPSDLNPNPTWVPGNCSDSSGSLTVRFCVTCVSTGTDEKRGTHRESRAEQRRDREQA